MSGPISYHGVVGHTSKVTLPSADLWYNNMNILRDPPASITTRKKDRVGMTSEVTQMIQESGDRLNDSILVYPRGINPFVGVSYNNFGNNGGQMVNGITRAPPVRNSQAFLPYRVVRDGAFRPPIRDLRTLYPISRLPRTWTSSFTQPGFIDFSKNALCLNDKRAVKTDEQVLKGQVYPTTTYKISMPIVEPFEVKYVIKNPTTISAYSGIKTMGRVTTEEYIPKKLHRHTPIHEVNTNISKNIYSHVIEPVQERQYVSNRPYTSGYTNIVAQNDTSNVNRDYKLKPTVNAGEFEGVPNIPSISREGISEINTERTKVLQKAFDLQQEHKFK
jgi:hypothetical protein